MTAALSIRAAVVGDVPLIHTFIRELAEYEKIDHLLVATNERLHDSLFGPHPGAEVIIAEVDGAPVGFALFFHNYSTVLAQRGLYLEDLFVRPAFRGHGVGRALLTRLAQIARERNCGRLEWWVLDWNEDAIRFYRSLGAEAMTEWTVYRVTGEALEKLGGP